MAKLPVVLFESFQQDMIISPLSFDGAEDVFNNLLSFAINIQVLFHPVIILFN